MVMMMMKMSDSFTGDGVAFRGVATLSGHDVRFPLDGYQTTSCHRYYHNISGCLIGLVINCVTVSSLLSNKRPQNTSQHQHVMFYITIIVNMVTAVRGQNFSEGAALMTSFYINVNY